MVGIRLYDKIFAHASCVGNCYETHPKHFEWVRSGPDLPVCVFTDFSLESVRRCEGKIKVAWLVESPAIFGGPYRKILGLAPLFDVVLTFDRWLLKRGEPFRRYSLGGCWIREPTVERKTKMVSIVASNKRTTLGQWMRQEILNTVGGIDRFGRGTNEIADKGEGLWPYRYSVAIENCQQDYYFTEKLIDCFATGTVPIYWGCPSIGEVFNPDGMIRFQTVSELRDILDGLTEEDYVKRERAILENYERAMGYTNTEDRLWDEHLRWCVSEALLRE